MNSLETSLCLLYGSGWVVVLDVEVEELVELDVEVEVEVVVPIKIQYKDLLYLEYLYKCLLLVSPCKYLQIYIQVQEELS